MAALPLDGPSLRLPIAPRRKRALKQEVKAADSFTTAPPGSSIGAREQNAPSPGRAPAPAPRSPRPAEFLGDSCVFKRLTVVSSKWRSRGPTLAAFSLDRAAFHSRTRLSIRSRFPPSVSSAPEPDATDAARALLTFSSHDSRLLAHKSGKKHTNSGESDARAHAQRKGTQTRVHAARMYKN